MDTLLEAFIAESRENLETAGRCFLELEKTPGDDNILNDLFRAMHTIKGSSGLFDIISFTTVVHASEDVLDTVRSGELSLTSEHVDIFLETMDQVNAWLDDLESTEALGPGAEEKSKKLTIALRALLGDSGGEITAEVSCETPSADIPIMQEPPEWLMRMPDELRMELFKEVSAGQESAIVAVEYIPDTQCFFAGDDPLHTIRSLPGIRWFHIHHREPWLTPEELDPYQCNLVFYAVASGDENAIRHYMRYVTEETLFTRLTADQLVIPTGVAAKSAPYEEFIRSAPELITSSDWDKLRRLIAPFLKSGKSTALQDSALRWMDAMLQDDKADTALLSTLMETIAKGEFKRPDLTSARTSVIDGGDVKETKCEEAPEQGGAFIQTLSEEVMLKAAEHVLETQRKILSLSCAPERLSGRIASVSAVITNLFHVASIPTAGLKEAIESARSKEAVEPFVKFLADVQLNVKPKCEPVAKACDAPQERRVSERRTGTERRQTDASSGTKPTVPLNKILKIDQERIDALMDLVGELVVAKNALPFLAKRAEDDFGTRPLAKEIKAQYAVINRLSEEMQRAMMQIRMVPVSNVFQRFPRLVRDLSRKLNKKIRLSLEGEETEADKNVVDNLADPLIHLVRNSLDHGLETAQEREASGKSAEGSIILRAVPHDDQVVIEVIDDGRGIDSAVIKRKAYEKGIIDEHRLETISDHDALQLILTAGFSTAEQVSDLSGRGVGMDVVRSAVNGAGGSVVVHSEKGKGSTVRLSLPLSMAVSRVMMIEVDSQSYGISMEDIIETVRIPTDSIHRIKNNDAMVLRDRLIPMFHLRGLLQLPPLTELPEEVGVVVMTVGGAEMGVVIDAFHEGIDIIQKPLEGIMANNSNYSGTALLGDGRVLLVLNIKELLSCR